IESLLRATKRVAARSAHALPQSAVVGSMCVGTVSGSGAANAITIGSATIPAMIGAGMPPATAAAIESASSLGGQLMPPVMGVAAFLMAEFMGKSYFEVVARGYVPALIYYATVAVSVYLLALRHRTRQVAGSYQKLTWRDLINLAAFLSVIAGLFDMIAAWNMTPSFPAPWVVHFFAFFLGVWGELTPPPSLVAAVTAKIANASFYTTLNRALQICVSLFTLMAGVFVHPALVIEPGFDQFGAALLILVSTI